MKMTGKIILAAVAVAALSGTAMAADLSIPAAAPVAAAPAAPANWDGPYIGANIGYSWADADHVPGVGFPGPAAGNDLSPSGFEVGGQIGYNFHLSDSVVGGVEANIDWSDESASAAFPGFGTIGHAINWDGNILAKLGFDVGGNILPYVDAGFAFANATRTDTAFGGETATETHTGWTVGAGIEAMLADHVSGFVSYNYSDFGTQGYDYGGGGSVPNVHLTDNIVKAGINYHF